MERLVWKRLAGALGRGRGGACWEEEGVSGKFFFVFFFEGSGYVEVNEGSLGDDVVVGDGQ